MCKFFVYFAVCATVNCAVMRQRPIADRFNHRTQCRACMSVMCALKGIFFVFFLSLSQEAKWKKGEIIRRRRPTFPSSIEETAVERGEYGTLIKEIRNGAVAKSYMRKGILIYEERRKYLVIYEEAVSHTVYDFATNPFRISLYVYEENFIFFFISVISPSRHSPFFLPIVFDPNV